MGFCHHKRRRRPVVVCVPIRRRRHHRRTGGAAAIINQRQRVGSMSGLLNIPIQIPINLGDATAINNSRNNAVTNIL